MTAVAEPDGVGTVRQAVERRLAALRAEYETGQLKLAEIERQEAFLRERLLMLRGAVQALDDLQAELGQPNGEGDRKE
jgi:predicted nuclease with TOPRIM domain